MPSSHRSHVVSSSNQVNYEQYSMCVSEIQTPVLQVVVSQRIRCPHCAEAILPAAKICPHCHLNPYQPLLRIHLDQSGTDLYSMQEAKGSLMLSICFTAMFFLLLLLPDGAGFGAAFFLCAPVALLSLGAWRYYSNT